MHANAVGNLKKPKDRNQKRRKCGTVAKKRIVMLMVNDASNESANPVDCDSSHQIVLGEDKYIDDSTSMKVG